MQPDVAWYVRPVAGGQFGPADQALIEQWVTEGRVGADAYVWRTGWDDWRRAGEAFPRLAEVEPAATTEPTATAPPVPLPSAAEAGSTEAESPPVVNARERYYRHKRQARQWQYVIVVLLLVLALVLAGVLIYVLRQTTLAPVGPVTPAAATPADKAALEEAVVVTEQPPPTDDESAA